MGKYVIGIDGGGTKTHCALFDTDGNMIDFIDWGATNHECLKGGYEQLSNELSDMLNEVLSRNNACIDDLLNCVFGMAGVDTKKQHREISDIIKNLGIKSFTLCNDAYLGIKAGCMNGYGICAINGTGFSVGGIDPNGRMLQIGGQGALTGDFGGGGFLAEKVISSVYNYFFKGYKKTIMAEMLFKELRIKNKLDLMDAATEKLSKLRREICRIVYEAANEQDTVALKILDDMGLEYAHSIDGILKELDFQRKEHIEIVLAGSQFTKGENARAISIMKSFLQFKYPQKRLEIKIQKNPNAAGAVIWALEDTTDRYLIYEKVIKEFELKSGMF